MVIELLMVADSAAPASTFVITNPAVVEHQLTIEPIMYGFICYESPKREPGRVVICNLDEQMGYVEDLDGLIRRAVNFAAKEFPDKKPKRIYLNGRLVWETRTGN